MKKKKKVVKKIVPICGYCAIYQAIPDIRRKQSGVRECLICDKEVDFNTTACDSFVFGQVFFCSKNEQMIHIPVCLSRQLKKICSSKCQQGKVIKKIFELTKDNNDG